MPVWRGRRTSPFPIVSSQQTAWQIVERRPGSVGATDLGVPGDVATGERAPLGAEEAARQTTLVTASWTVFDRIAAAAPPTLRKGPRGGGRDRDAMIAYILAAETAYARKLSITRRHNRRETTRRPSPPYASMDHSIQLWQAIGEMGMGRLIVVEVKSTSGRAWERDHAGPCRDL